MWFRLSFTEILIIAMQIAILVKVYGVGVSVIP